MSVDKEIISILLGDGHVSKNGVISMHHGIAQKDYLMYKVDCLSKHGIKMRIRESDKLSYGEVRKFIKAEGYASNVAKEVRKLLYPDGKKIVPIEYAKCFDFRDWAFIFMDDGRTNYISHYNTVIGGVRTRVETKKFTNRYEICTESFDVDSNNALVSSLLSLGVESYISNSNRIIISRSSSKAVFYNGVKDYIVPPMLYKIDAIPSLSYKLQ